MINDLTPEQKAAMPKYVEKWLKIGTCVDTMDPELAKSIVVYLYEKLLKKPVPEIVLCKSPKDAWNQVCERAGKKMDFVWPYLDGQFNVAFFAFYDFFNLECNVQYGEHWDWYKSTANIGPVFPFENVCFVSDRPQELHFIGGETNKQLHNDKGPSILYRDGYATYTLNGVAVPKWLVETPREELDCKKLLTTTNAEIRREFVRKAGIEKVCKDLNAQVVDARDEYELLMLDLGDGRTRPYLKMINPSIGTYHIEGVHPDCKTVDDAIKFRNKTDVEPLVKT